MLADQFDGWAAAVRDTSGDWPRALSGARAPGAQVPDSTRVLSAWLNSA